MQYLIHENNMERLQKKLNTIKNKCNKNNTIFKFEIIDTKYIQNQNECYATKYYVVDVKGIVKFDNWVFIATIEHKNNGNVIRQFNFDYKIPQKYFNVNAICEHCRTNRARKDTYLIINTITNEYKQVGKNCLQEFTNGLSAEMVAQYISYFDEIEKSTNSISIGKQFCKYFDINDVLLNVVETVKNYGFVSKSKCYDDFSLISTSQRVQEFMGILFNANIEKEKEKIAYNPYTEDNQLKINQMLKWLKELNNDNQYFHNLKTIINDKYCELRDFGILCSLPTAYFKDLETQKEKLDREQKNKEKQLEYQNQKYIGKIGERINFNILKWEIIACYDTMYGTMQVYKFITTDNDVLIWKTNHYMPQNTNINNIKATIKQHNEHNGEKQTEISRTKIVS